MNFNVYLNKAIGKKINRSAEELHRSRNSIINEALEEWLAKHTHSSWPTDFFDFKPQNINFIEYRNEFAQVKEDPLE